MQRDPSITIDWDLEEVQLHLGARLKRLAPITKVDLIGDIAGMAHQELLKAKEELSPGLAQRAQRHENARRTYWAKELTGKSIKAAHALKTGHLALELEDGRVVVFCHEEESIDVQVCSSIEAALSEDRHDGGRYTEQPSEEDMALAPQDEMTRTIRAIQCVH